MVFILTTLIIATEMLLICFNYDLNFLFVLENVLNWLGVYVVNSWHSMSYVTVI